jgi:hypothetical protein
MEGSIGSALLHVKAILATKCREIPVPGISNLQNEHDINALKKPPN